MLILTETLLMFEESISPWSKDPGIPLSSFSLGKCRSSKLSKPLLSVGRLLDGPTMVNLPLICLFRALLCSSMGLGTSRWIRVYSSVRRSGFLSSGGAIVSRSAGQKLCLNTLTATMHRQCKTHGSRKKTRTFGTDQDSCSGAFFTAWLTTGSR